MNKPPEILYYDGCNSSEEQASGDMAYSQDETYYSAAYLMKEIEGMGKHPRLTPDHEIDRAEFEGYNAALDDVLELIKPD